jgi:hypothetical protein
VDQITIDDLDVGVERIPGSMPADRDEVELARQEFYRRLAETHKQTVAVWSDGVVSRETPSHHG